MNTGPSRKRRLIEPDDWSSSVWPTTSDGIRSGVNCSRVKRRSNAAASVLASSVLATPGTPSSSTWPLTSSAAIVPDSTPSWPTTTLPTSSRTASTASRREAHPRGGVSPVTAAVDGSGNELVTRAHLVRTRLRRSARRLDSTTSWSAVATSWSSAASTSPGSGEAPPRRRARRGRRSGVVGGDAELGAQPAIRLGAQDPAGTRRVVGALHQLSRRRRPARCPPPGAGTGSSTGRPGRMPRAMANTTNASASCTSAIHTPGRTRSASVWSPLPRSAGAWLGPRPTRMCTVAARRRREQGGGQRPVVRVAQQRVGQQPVVAEHDDDAGAERPGEGERAVAVVEASRRGDDRHVVDDAVAHEHAAQRLRARRSCSCRGRQVGFGLCVVGPPAARPRCTSVVGCGAGERAGAVGDDGDPAAAHPASRSARCCVVSRSSSTRTRAPSPSPAVTWMTSTAAPCSRSSSTRPRVPSARPESRIERFGAGRARSTSSSITMTHDRGHDDARSDCAHHVRRRRRGPSPSPSGSRRRRAAERAPDGPVR